jgi:hypothetical protein
MVPGVVIQAPGLCLGEERPFWETRPQPPVRGPGAVLPSSDVTARR